MRVINTPNMPKANGHYSHCVEHNGVLYLSGQLPFNPETRIMPEGIEMQTQQVLNNVERILTEAGSCKEQVLQVRIYIPDIEHWDKVNEIYSIFFGDHMPARCVIPTRNLHFGALVEIEVTAFHK
ncbi:MAG: enamine deaminase RidA [Bacteroidetes bacterium HGW-Bacteroidetes-15]|nr:MAG: enamine deaminase RidA [Bacteroidetes bacterium HGW-Bacteroidetes-15]